MAKATYLEYNDGGVTKRKEKCNFFICTEAKPTPVVDVCLPEGIKKNNYNKSIHIPIGLLKRLILQAERRQNSWL